MKILEPNELCKAILSMPPCKPLQSTPTQLLRSFESLVFGQFSNEDIKKIFSSLSNGASYQNVLLMHSFAFPFRIELLQVISTDEDLRKSQATYLTAVILFSYLAWNIILFQTKSNEHLFELITAIKCMITTSCSIKNQFLVLLHSAFYDLFLTYLKFTDISDFHVYFELLKDYFGDFSLSAPKSSYGLFPKILTRLLTSSPNTSLSSIGNSVISLIFSIISRDPQKIPRDSLISIIQKLPGPLSELEINTLLLFSHLHQLVGSDAILPFIPLLPLAIITSIQSNSPYISFKSADKTQLKENTKKLIRLSNTNLFPVTYGPLSHEMFNEVPDLSNNYKFPEKIPLENLIDPKFLPLLQLVQKIVIQDKTLAKSFLELLPSYIQSLPGKRDNCDNDNNESEWKFDIIAAFYFISYTIKSEFQLYPRLELCCNHLIFDPKVSIFNNSDFLSIWPQISSLRSHAIEFLLEGNSSIQCSH